MRKIVRQIWSLFGLKRLQAETAAELDALFGRALKGEL